MKKKRGYSFIELSIVLSIVAISISIIFSVGVSARDSIDVSLAKGEVQSLEKVIKTLFRHENGNFTQLNSSILFDSKYIPDSMKTGVSSIVNVYGNTVTFIGNATGFSFNYPVPTQASCITLATSLISNTYSLKVNGLSVTSLTTASSDCIVGQNTIVIGGS